MFTFRGRDTQESPRQLSISLLYAFIMNIGGRLKYKTFCL